MNRTEDAKLVEKIHGEFSNAEKELDDLLISAGIIAEQDQKDEVLETIDVYRSLGKIGFKQSETVKEATNYIEIDHSTGERLSEALDAIRKYYPNNKGIIHANQLYNILEKYNLYIGGIESFTGKIPYNNAVDIKKFNDNLPNIDVVIRCKKPMNKGYFNVSPNKNTAVSYTYAIVAPIKDFDSKEKVIIGNEFIELMDYSDLYQEKMNEVKRDAEALKRAKDPVVLLPVYVKNIMLFVIVTMWGPEAELPEFKNAEK